MKLKNGTKNMKMISYLKIYEKEIITEQKQAFVIQYQTGENN
jgi:hypothetical protein